MSWQRIQEVRFAQQTLDFCRDIAAKLLRGYPNFLDQLGATIDDCDYVFQVVTCEENQHVLYRERPPILCRGIPGAKRAELIVQSRARHAPLFLSLTDTSG